MNPDYLVILGWMHSDAIISKNVNFLESGGKFIKIHPEFEIVDVEKTHVNEMSNYAVHKNFLMSKKKKIKRKLMLKTLLLQIILQIYLFQNLK